jgi:hypothetical protein
MLNKVLAIGQNCVNYVNGFDRTHWLWLSVAVLIIGFICMRGFGSRTNY